MAENVLREFAFRLGFQIEDEDLANLSTGLKQVREGWNGVVSAARRTAAEIGIAAAAVGVGLGKIVADTARMGDEAAKSAVKLGLQVEELQELRFAADRSGASSAALGVGIRTLTRNLDAFARGSGEAKESLLALGFTAADVTGPGGELQSVPELFAFASEAIASARTESERLALAQRLLGESGGELLPLFAGGADGLARLRAEARQLGGVLDADTARAAEEFTDRLTDLRFVLAGVRNQIGAALLPVLNDLSSSFLRWYRSNQLVIRQRLARFADQIRRALVQLGEVVQDLDGIVRRRLGGWERVFQAVAVAAAAMYAAIVGARFAGPLVTLASGIATVTGAVLGLSTAMGGLVAVLVAAGVIVALGQLALAIGGLLLVVDDLSAYLAGQDSLWGRWIDQVSAAGDEGWALANLMQELALYLGSVGDFAQEAGGLIADVFTLAVINATTAANALLVTLRSIVDTLLSLVGTDVAGVLQRLADIYQGARVQVEGATAAVAATRAQVQAASSASRDASGPVVAAVQRFTSAASVQVQVDARGREAPGEVGAEVGFSVDRAIRGAASLFGGA